MEDQLHDILTSWLTAKERAVKGHRVVDTTNPQTQLLRELKGHTKRFSDLIMGGMNIAEAEALAELANSALSQMRHNAQIFGG